MGFGVGIRVRVVLVAGGGAVPSLVVEVALPPALSSTAALVACSAALATCTGVAPSSSGLSAATWHSGVLIVA